MDCGQPPQTLPRTRRAPPCNQCLLSERETLTGEDTTERMEMALGQPITSREQSPERKLQERKL